MSEDLKNLSNNIQHENLKEMSKNHQYLKYSSNFLINKFKEEMFSLNNFDIFLEEINSNDIKSQYHGVIGIYKIFRSGSKCRNRIINENFDMVLIEFIFREEMFDLQPYIFSILEMFLKNSDNNKKMVRKRFISFLIKIIYFINQNCLQQVN